MSAEEEQKFFLAAYQAAQRFASNEILAGLARLTDPGEDGSLVITGAPCTSPPVENADDAGDPGNDGLVTGWARR